MSKKMYFYFSKIRIFISNIFGNFEKLIDILHKISEKSGNFDIIFLIGKVFNIEKSFNEIFKLEKIDSKFIIFDSSEVGNIIKHKYSEPLIFSEKITILDRKGIFTIDGFKIGYLSGFENEDYIKENLKNPNMPDYTKAYFTGDKFKRDDVLDLLKEKEENKNLIIDILLTHSIPSIIFQELLKSKSSPIYFLKTNESLSLKISKENMENYSSYSCNLIAKFFSPRYIVSSIDDFFYERNPYYNSELSTGNNNDTKILTRFINLAYVKLLFIKIFYLFF